MGTGIEIGRLFSKRYSGSVAGSVLEIKRIYQIARTRKICLEGGGAISKLFDA
jgi:hypothetical protein